MTAPQLTGNVYYNATCHGLSLAVRMLQMLTTFSCQSMPMRQAFIGLSPLGTDKMLQEAGMMNPGVQNSPESC